MPARSVVLAAIASALAATPAQAAMMPPADRAPHARMTAVVAAVAADFWGTAHPLRVVPATTAELERATGQANASGTAHGDTIWIHDRWLADAATSYETRIAICTAGVHEAGHLRGHDHSNDPRSVMFASQRVDHMVYGCYQRLAPRVKRASKLKLRRGRGGWRALAPAVTWLAR